MKKRILTMLLAVLLCAGLLPLGAAAADLKFVDVSPEAWYYNDVKTAVDSGLVNGKSETTYCPDDLLTYAEAVKLAACMNQKYETGVVSLVNGDPWYQSYVDYAKMKNIIAQDYDWNSKATRAGYMAIFAHALPDTALTATNSVPDGSIPDVPKTHPAAAEIYKLYRAGILQGSEDTYNGAWTKHLCKPADNIKRSEVAAILTRMMFVEKRISFSMGEEAPATADLKITKQPAAYQMKAADDTGASFAVEISGGKAPYKYQWIEELDGTPSWTSDAESKETKNTFAVKNAATLLGIAKIVKVYVVVTDAEGKKVTSDKADLKAFTAGLKIEKEPEPVTLKAGEKEATFSITVSGGKAPYEYYWVLENDATGMPKTVLSAETTSVFKTGDLTEDVKYFGADMDVFCVVTDYDGQKVTSKKVALNADTLAASLNPLKITTQPVSKTGTEGTWVSFTVTVTGGKEPYSYRWESTQGDSDFGSITCANVNGEYTATLWVQIKKGYFPEGEDIRCVITDANGTKVTTNTVTAKLTGSASDPLKLVDGPYGSYKRAEGELLSVSVTVSGGKTPYTYDWQYKGDGTTTEGTTWKSFPSYAYDNGKSTFNYIVEFLDDHYSFRCVITDANGDKVESETFFISLTAAASDSLKITKQPKSATVAMGAIVSFDITVTGGKAPYKYDWQMSNTSPAYSDYGKWPSFTSSLNGKSTLSFETDWYNFVDEYAIYRCVVTDADGKQVISDTFEIYEAASTSSGWITQQPSDYWMQSSQEDVTFTIKVDGAAPYTFDWYYGRPGGYMQFDSTFTNNDFNTTTLTLSDYDFEDLQASDIDVFCVVTDDWNNTITSRICHVYRY